MTSAAVSTAALHWRQASCTQCPIDQFNPVPKVHSHPGRDHFDAAHGGTAAPDIAMSSPSLLLPFHFWALFPETPNEIWWSSGTSLFEKVSLCQCNNPGGYAHDRHEIRARCLKSDEFPCWFCQPLFRRRTRKNEQVEQRGFIKRDLYFPYQLDLRPQCNQPGMSLL